MRRTSMTPSPIMPRFIRTACMGTSQSQTWKPTIRPAARCGFVARPAVVLDARLPLRARGCPEHPPSTHARHGEAGTADHAHGPVESRLGQLVAPHGDVRYAVTCTRFDGVLEARPLGGDLVQAEPVDRGGP